MTPRSGEHLPPPAEDERPHPTRSVGVSGWPRAAELAARFIISVGLSAVGTAALSRAINDGLDVHTDVVGYPIVANFDVLAYFVNYGLVVVAFPMMAVLLFHVITWASRRIRWAPPRPDRSLLPSEKEGEREAPARSAHRLLQVTLTSSAFVGAVWSAGVAIALGSGESWLASVLLPVTGGYVVAVVVIGLVIARTLDVAPEPAMSAVNAVGGALSVLVLLLASSSTQIMVASTGRIEDQPFVPLPVVITGAIAGASVVAAMAARWPTTRWPSIERGVVLSVVGPIALFLLVARLPGGLGPLDLFHEGERLGASRLIGEGHFPWRDLLFIHGLLEDVGTGSIGGAIFGDSRWALHAGDAVLFTPVYWIAGYALSVYLFRRNLWLLLASQLLVVLGSVTFAHIRFVLMPVLLLLLAAVLGRGSWPRVVAFTTVAVAQVIVTPESAFITVAACAVVVLHDLTHRRPGEPFVVGFGRTLRCTAVGVAAVGTFVAYLSANDALGPFIEYYRIFSVGHELSGGIPVQWPASGAWSVSDYSFWVIAPILVILASWWYLTATVRGRRRLSTADWVVGAAVLGLIPYFTKFLSRADDHIYHVAAAALVSVLYIAFRVITWVEERIPRHPLITRPVSCAVVVGVLLLAPLGGSVLETLPRRMSATVPTEPRLARVGFESEPDPAVTEEVLRDLRNAVAPYLDDGGTFFDFTNSPALFNYFLDLPLATRYFHVSMAIPEIAQEDLVDELKRERPEVVAFSSHSGGLPIWDEVVNPVRHYLVSDYLLDHYRPYVSAHGYMFMARNDLPAVPVSTLRSSLAVEPQTTDLYFFAQPCAWGYAPEFLDTGEPEPRSWVDLGVQSTGAVVDVGGWVADPATHAPASEVLIVRDGQVIARAPAGMQRPDVVAAFEDERLLASGFSLTVTDVTEEEASDLRIIAVMPSGSRLELKTPFETSGGTEVIRDDAGAAVDVDDHAALGSVDRIQAFPRGNYRLDGELDFSEYDWLELRVAAPLGDDAFTVTDGVAGDGHKITFRSLPDGSVTYRVRVGSCPQWHGYEQVMFRSPTAPELLEVRLGR